MNHTLRFALLSIAVAGSTLFAGAAQAADREVTIINKTRTTLVSFHASRVNTKDWEEDILGNDLLKPGQSIVIDIDDGTGACRFDFKGLFEDGDEVVKENVNVCRISEFSFTQ